MTETLVPARLNILSRADKALLLRAEQRAAEIKVLQRTPKSPATRKRLAEIEQEAAADLGLAKALASERRLLETASARNREDATVHLALLAYLRRIPATAGRGARLVASVAADPALRAQGLTPRITAARAETVLALAVQGPDIIPQMITAAGGSSAFLQVASIAHAAYLRVRGSAYLWRDVAVLLPLRLETIFREAAGSWRMLLRIVPDEISVTRHDPAVTSDELADLRAMWKVIFGELPPEALQDPVASWLDTPRGRLAWEAFASRHGNGRAAWLVGAHPPIVENGGILVEADEPVEESSAINRVGGFPETIEIWAAFGDAEPERIDSTAVNREALIFDVIGAREGDDGLIEERDRWWHSWKMAQEVGLGRVIDLPHRMGPQDIRALYAIGVGDATPQEHFSALIEAGGLATLPLGAPTNAVDANQAASLGHDPEEWRHVAMRRLHAAVNMLIDDPGLSRALAGPDGDFPAVPRGDDRAALDRTMIGGLWSVLWGHAFRDLWSGVEGADQLGAFAREHLRPEGPLPPIRVGRQAYGLLPTSEHAAWQTVVEEGTAGAVERLLLDGLLTMRDHWAAVARTTGNSVGADTQRLIDLITRDASSAAYAWRLFLPEELWRALWAGTSGLDEQAFDEWIKNAYRPLFEILRRGPEDPPGMRIMLAGGAAQDLAIPLVLPTSWPHWFYKEGSFDEQGNPVPAMTPREGFVQMLKDMERLGHIIDWVEKEWRVLPDSLLVRLLLNACARTAAAVVQTDQSGPAPLLEPVFDTGGQTLLQRLAEDFHDNLPHDNPAGEMRQLLVKALRELVKFIEAAGEPDPAAPWSECFTQIERAMRATLDCATHRIDPWFTGMAARRLDHLASRTDTRFRLGVYGWVEGPMLGQPGPTTGGFLHAPSHAQALTAVILRDRHVSESLETATPPGGRNIWSMQLSSDRIRLAQEMVEEVRLGAHLHEVLGRRVERVAASTPGRDPVADTRTLRQTFPLYPGLPQWAIPPGTPCNGLIALNALLDAAQPLLPLDDAKREALRGLREALDAYGDLLVSEAVHQVVTGHADAAGSAMDAAAGLAAPPTLDFTTTPWDAEALASTVISLTPFVPSSVDIEAAPVLIADASVAAAIERLAGDGDEWLWRMDDRQVSLASLGLTPADTLSLPGALLDMLARHRLGAATEAPLRGNAPERHELARRASRVLGGQPAWLRDIAQRDRTEAMVEQDTQVDASIAAELQQRLERLMHAAESLATALEQSTPAEAGALLFRALRWGIWPAPPLGAEAAFVSAILDNEQPEDATLLPPLMTRAATELRARIAAAMRSTEGTARTIAALATPDAALPVLGAFDLAFLQSRTGIVADPDRTLAADWLPVVAAVRPQLARLEALHLEAELKMETAPAAPIVAFSSSPGDPWGKQALEVLAASRDTARGNEPGRAAPRFVAAFALDGAIAFERAGERVAVGLIDSWAESVPSSTRSTTAAFGFNAPSSRPPQAVLLAVPPSLQTDAAWGGIELTTAKLIRVLQDTRRTMYARAVDAERLGAALSGVPTSIFDATGKSGVSLHPDTSFGA